MPEPFILAFVVGVTPGKWARLWTERMPRPLEMRPLAQSAALASLLDGSAHVALLRLPVEDPTLSVIPLYVESAVVVVPKDHALAEFETVAIDDLERETVLEAGDVAGDATTTPDTMSWAAAVDLVAANVGVAIMPHSVARARSRRDVVARPMSGVAETQVALAWVTARAIPETEAMVGIVRGRTANSSRGGESVDTTTKKATAKATPVKKGGTGGKRTIGGTGKGRGSGSRGAKRR